MIRALIPAILAATLLGAPAAADLVAPSERVRTRVMVRAEPVAGSRRVGALAKEETAEHLGTESGWHRVRLDGGAEGWVSAAWTEIRVVRTLPPAPPVEDEGFDLEARRVGRGFGGAVISFLRDALLAPFGWPRVDVMIREPEMGRVHRHRDPDLPVAGLASARGARGKYDIVLVIDASTSTNEFSEADVNGDGRAQDRWKGPDSIFQAQVTAARDFVAVLRRMPHNRDGQRIRVGVVTFAGDERFHRIPEGRSFKPSPEAIYGLALRDSVLVSPLTGDYDALDRALRELSREEPSGMTNFAAGVGRAIIELEGNIGRGAKSRPRDDAEKVVHFLTDGKPRLPYDRDVAERAAVFAARMAGSEEIHINVFAMGRNVVTRDVNDAIRRMVARSNGRLVELNDPGDIVAILRTTSFSFVDRVKLVNRTRGTESDYISTGIDGSFYGEIPLVEGQNQIEVVAVMLDEREASERFRITFERVPADLALVQRLEDIRRENEALIEQIRQQLARDIRETRARNRQKKVVDIEAEDPRGR